MWRFHKPNKAPQHKPTNFHEKTFSRSGTSAIVSGTRMCRPVRDTETLLTVGLGEAKLKCERLPQGADGSFESPGHLRLEPKSSRLTPQPWPLVPWGRWGPGHRWPNCSTPPTPRSPSFSCLRHGAGPWFSVYDIHWIFSSDYRRNMQSS